MNNTIIQMMLNKITTYSKPLKIGFPDGDDPRILTAVEKLKTIPNIMPIVINQEFMAKHSLEKIIKCFEVVRGSKNSASDFEKWSHIPNYFAMALLELGELDCVLGGASTPTAELLRPALQIIRPSQSIITSFFWMEKDQNNYFLGDCAIVPSPNGEELASIGSLIANGAKNVFGFDPFIAMLSYSTNGSGGDKNQSVLKVRQASEILKEKGYRVLGETQFDAAFCKQTREYKWKQTIPNQPNIYVFPNLDAANIGYKIMKLTGKYKAIGPIVVGLNKPVNDLSRGCDWEEVFNLSLITLSMAIEQQISSSNELTIVSDKKER